MAVEKEISENIVDETKVEEIQEQPEGLPPIVEVEGEEVAEENLEDDFGANLAEEMDELRQAEGMKVARVQHRQSR